MELNEKKLTFKLVGDNSSLKSAFKDTTKATTGLQSTFKKFGTIVAGAFAIKQIAGFTTEIMDVGRKFEAQMSKVQGISQAVPDDLEKLEKVAKKMGSTTVHSATDSAKALEYMALAGWKTNQMVEGLPAVLNLATASSTDLAMASDIVTDTMSMFQMEANESARTSNVFAIAQATANTNVLQLGEAMKYVGANANSMGSSLETTSSLLMVLADNGIKGSSAGTSLNRMMVDMKKAMDSGAIAIGNTTIAVTNADGSYRDILAVIRDVEQATINMSASERDLALSQVFGVQATKSLNSILGSGTETLFNYRNELINTNMTAEQMAEIMGNNLNGKIMALKSAWEGVQLMLYDLLLPVFTLVVLALQELIKWVTEFANYVKENFDNVGDKTKEFQEWFEELKEKVLFVFDSLVEAITVWYQENQAKVDAVIEAFMKFWKGISEVIGLVLDLLAMFMDVLATYFLGDAINYINTFLDAFNGIIGVLKGVLKIIKGIFTGEWALIWEGALDIFEGIFGAITSIFKNIMNGIIIKLNTAIKAINKIKIPEWVPRYGGRSINIPRIPMLAEGGIVSSPTLAMIGEGGESEAVIPLSKLGNMMNGGGGGRPMNVTIELDGRRIARSVGHHLVDDLKMRTVLSS